jgi:putative hemolysin
MDENSVQYLDVKNIFYSKAPGIAKILPNFVYKYLKHIVHEDFLNQILRNHCNKFGIDFVHGAIKDFNVTIIEHGIEDLPDNGRFIFVSNHPLGGFDGLMLMSLIDKKYHKVKTPVNDLLMNIESLRPLFIPINKHGSQTKDAALLMDEDYHSDAQILTFPAGLVSRKIKGQIIDLDWKKNFIKKAVDYQRDVIPVFVSGRNTLFFYNLSNIRKFLGIKANLEMFYLADETYKHRNKTFHVTFGHPIPFQTFDQSKTTTEWAAWVKEQVYRL